MERPTTRDINGSYSAHQRVPQEVNITDDIPVPASRVRADSLASEASILDTPTPEGDNTQGNPIERFRAQYGEVAAYLREHDMEDPYPRSDHAWIAAGVVDKLGFYEPCMSFTQDRANAVARHEEKLRTEKEEAEYQELLGAVSQQRREEAIATALADPNSGIHYLLEYAHGEPAVNPMSKEDLVQAGIDASNKVSYQALAVGRGYKAAQDILANGLMKTMSERRGKRLLKQAEKRDRRAMLRDYFSEAEASDPRATLVKPEDLVSSAQLGTIEEEWEELDSTRVWASAKGGSKTEQPGDAAETSSMFSFADMEGSYAVDNGKPMVKQGSVKKLFKMVTGHH